MEDLKYLKKKLKELQSDLECQKQKVAREQKLQSDIQKSINSINEKIKSFEIKGIEVTDHAVVRYFERVLGYDIEQVKENIIPDGQKSMAAQLKTCKFPIGDGRKAVIRDCVIVSII